MSSEQYPLIGIPLVPISTDFLFSPGKMTIIMDGGAGSSGKGKLASFIGEHSKKWSFCCNAFMSNAAHWVVLDDGTKYLYQTLNSVAYLKHYEKLYICGGAVIELSSLLREIKENGLNPTRLGIHPLVAIVQQKDIDYEAGLCNFEGDQHVHRVHSDAMKIGSTIHGVGAARARRILRRSDVVVARDIPELHDYICNTHKEIMDRLDRGEAGLMEIAQGFQLSYLIPEYYPKCTSRNCSVAAGLDDCQLPPSVAGNVIINFRTFPIRVSSNKFIDAKTDKILTAQDMDTMRAEGREADIKTLVGDSGGCYPDQQEITWDDVTRIADSTTPIVELSSLTKLPRRVYTFSHQNLKEAIRFNTTSGKTYISINFMNYIDGDLTGRRGGGSELTNKAQKWLDENVAGINGRLTFLGTGARTDDMLVI